MRVGDQYRTNNLSLIPGGSIVSVVFNNGTTLDYDKVKSPKKYISRIEGKEQIAQISVNGKIVWDNSQKIKYWEM